MNVRDVIVAALAGALIFNFIIDGYRHELLMTVADRVITNTKTLTK